MAYTRETKTALYTLLLVVSILSLASIACNDTCIERNDDGVCIAVASDVVKEPAKVWNEVADSVSGVGTGNVFAGEAGNGICKVAGVNCD